MTDFGDTQSKFGAETSPSDLGSVRVYVGAPHGRCVCACMYVCVYLRMVCVCVCMYVCVFT